jgi:hypothetical protein
MPFFMSRNGSDTPGFMNSQESSAPLTLLHLSLISHGSSTIQRVRLQPIAVIITMHVRVTCARLLSVTWHNSITAWSNDLSSCSSRWFSIYVGYKMRFARNSWTRTFAGSSKPRSVGRSSEPICPVGHGFTNSRLHCLDAVMNHANLQSGKVQWCNSISPDVIYRLCAVQLRLRRGLRWRSL